MDKSTKILKRLELLHPKKIDLSLKRLKRLLNKLDNPHLKLSPVIHVAGTNGKGSVTSFLRSIFEFSNYKVHTYTSPHLINFNERIRINSKLISNNHLNTLLEECEYYNKAEEITFFEITTAAAFLAFSRIESDIILLETGLGGRFDATNVVENKLCSVITPISMDHMNFLGSTIEKIAKEKLGILKNSKKIVLSKQHPVVRKLARVEAKRMKIELFEEGSNWKIREKDFIKKNFSMFFEKANYNFNFPELFGEHQIDNASTAVATVLSLGRKDILDKNIDKGILSAKWPARMQNLKNGNLSSYMGKNFEIWLDGGHNLEASNIIKNIIEKWKKENVFLVIGMMIGKDPYSFIKKLIKNLSAIFLLPIPDHQYIRPYEIKNNIKKDISSKISIECSLDIKEVLKIIKENYPSGKLVICGSLYLAGEVLKQDGFKIN